MQLKTLCFIAMMSSLISACSDETDTLVSDNLPNNYQLTIQDTININEEDYINIADYNKTHFLSLEKENNEILIHNTQGKRTHTISRDGEGPEEYGRVWKLGFGENNTIIVVSTTKILVYDFEGNLIQTTHFDLSKTFPTTNNLNLAVVNQNEFVFSAIDNNLSSETPDFFEQSHNISILNTTNGEVRNFAHYESDNIYRKKFFPNNSDALFTYTDDGLLYVGFPYEKKIYQYDVQNGSLQKVITTSPDHFGKIEGSKKLDIQTQVRLLQKNASYLNLEATKDIIVTFYTNGMSDDDIAESVTKANDIIYKKKPHLGLYSTATGDKLCKDIDLPIGTALFKVVDNNTILLKRFFAPVNENEDEGNVLYLANISPMDTH